MESLFLQNRKLADGRLQWWLELLSASGVKTHWSCGYMIHTVITCCCCKSIYVTCFGSIVQKEKKWECE